MTPPPFAQFLLWNSGVNRRWLVRLAEAIDQRIGKPPHQVEPCVGARFERGSEGVKDAGCGSGIGD